MDENYIWAYLSMKKGDLDNDYYFYDDGRILHHYDRTISKRDIECYISPNCISNIDKERMLTTCAKECSEDIFNKIKQILAHE